MRPNLTASLRERGYLPRTSSTTWDDLWTSLAPYRLTVDVLEQMDDTYLSSSNRLSVLSATLSLTRQGVLLWRESPRARTQIPLPGLPAYQASRLAVGARRSPEFERLLYEDARKALNQRIAAHLRSLPACRPSDAPAPAKESDHPVPLPPSV